MKNVVLFKGGIETLDFFSNELAKSFTEMGYKTFIFDMSNQFDSFTELLSFCKKNETIMITFNFIGLSGENVFNNRGKLFFDEYNIRCINIVVDHPFYYHKNYFHLPRNYIQFCIDRTHIEYMKRFYKTVEIGPFLPLAGSYSSISIPQETYTHNEQFANRKYDIVFLGNYTPPSHFEPEITRLGDDYTIFYRDIIDDLILNPEQTIDSVFEKHLISSIPDISDSDLDMCMSNMIFIDLYIRFYMRGKVIKTLVDNGIKIHVFGNGLNLQSYRYPENLILHGGVDSDTCLKMLYDSKISLNVMPWFKDGAHDRIFNSAINGAVNLTDTSIYLKELFDNKNALKFYSLRKISDLPNIANTLLSNPDKLFEMSKNAYQITKQLHMWMNRALLIKEYF